LYPHHTRRKLSNQLELHLWRGNLKTNSAGFVFFGFFDRCSDRMRGSKTIVHLRSIHLQRFYISHCRSSVAGVASLGMRLLAFKGVGRLNYYRSVY